MMATVATQFEAHVASVRKLMHFDRDVLDLAIESIRDLRDTLKRHHKLDNPHLTADNTLQILEGFQKHDSLRPRYETIFNQALVLLVSYFSASIHDLFRGGVRSALDLSGDSSLLREQLSVTVGDLREVDFHVRDLIPDLLVQTKDISFQDMQSVSRAFKNYLEIQIDRDVTVNNIITGQACRHVIVHSGGIADDRLIRQLNAVVPREMKVGIRSGQPIQFTPDEVNLVADSMLIYLRNLSSLVATRVGTKV